VSSDAVLQLTTVSVIYDLADDAGHAHACEALLARDEIVTVRVGRGDEPTVFRADVVGATVAHCRSEATRIAREVGSRLGGEALDIDVQVLGPSAEETGVLSAGRSPRTSRPEPDGPVTAAT
jgi:class 3 adenylate cyclase